MNSTPSSRPIARELRPEPRYAKLVLRLTALMRRMEQKAAITSEATPSATRSSRSSPTRFSKRDLWSVPPRLFPSADCTRPGRPRVWRPGAEWFHLPPRRTLPSARRGAGNAHLGHGPGIIAAGAHAPRVELVSRLLSPRKIVVMAQSRHRSPVPDPDPAEGSRRYLRVFSSAGRQGILRSWDGSKPDSSIYCKGPAPAGGERRAPHYTTVALAEGDER